MITKLSRIIADFLIRQKIVPEEQREIYEYGFELSVSSVIGIIIVLAIGLISGKFWESVVFYIVFCFTRLFTGGFHAPNHLLSLTSIISRPYTKNTLFILLQQFYLLGRINTMKKILSFALCFAFVFLLNGCQGDTTVLWDWTDGIYNGSCLLLYRGQGVYTNYKFKPTDKKITVDLELCADEDWTDNRKLTVMLYKTSGSTWSNVSLKTFRFVPDPADPYKTFDFSHTFTGLDNDAEYCARLYNDSTIHDGYVDREYAVGANIYISNT